MSASWKSKRAMPVWHDPFETVLVRKTSLFPNSDWMHCPQNTPSTIAARNANAIKKAIILRLRVRVI